MGKVAVVGAGPAGIAAAIQLARSGHGVEVYESGSVGGTLRNAGWVENYPGFPGGIGGRLLVKQMEEQFYQYVDAVRVQPVERVVRKDAGYVINEQKYDGIVLCTGTVPRKAGFDGETELADAMKLFYDLEILEHWHDAREVGIIGGGEASLDMTLSLLEHDYKATVIHRSEPTGIKCLMGWARDSDINWVKGNVRQGRMQNEKVVLSLETEELAFDSVIVAVGREKALPELVGMDADDWPPGFFIAGDAARGSLGQTAMAVGDGVDAAMQMDRHLRSIE